MKNQGGGEQTQPNSLNVEDVANILYPEGSDEKADQNGEKTTSNAEVDKEKQAEQEEGEGDASKEKEGEGDASKDKSDEDKSKQGDSKPNVNYSLADLPREKDTLLSDEARERIVSYSKEQGLTKEQAKALLGQGNDLIADYNQSLHSQLKENSSKWMKEMESDKVFGGENLIANAEKARRVLDRFGDNQLKQDLIDANLGNHPGLSRMLMRIGQAMADDELVKGDKPAKAKTYEELFYGSSN